MINPSTLAAAVRNNVAAALAEDVGSGDISAAMLPADSAKAQIITRDSGIFCGLMWAQETAHQVDQSISLEALVADGEEVTPNQVLIRLSGPAPALLTAERTMLNFIQLLSGTATRTARYHSLIAHTATTLLDTRKTIPGLRLAQKYAVTCGGGANHRLGLYDAYLLKENHIAAAGSIASAVAGARQANPERPVEIEVESLDELQAAMAAGADIAMIDNFTLEETRAAVELAAGAIKLEASGGIDETSITEIAETGVDYISIGELTKRIEPMDLSMRFV